VAVTFHWHDDEYGYCLCDDPTPASHDREEHRAASRLTSEVEEHAGCTRRCCMDPQEIEP
jgi:hypothetical protein